MGEGLRRASRATAPALKVGDVVVCVDPRYFRPAEVDTLLGDPSKAKQKLGWVPEVTAQQMCAEMVREDPRPPAPRAAQGARSQRAGLAGELSMDRDLDQRIFVAGHRGMVGSAILRACRRWVIAT